MDDLISRKAALEELGECPENWTDSPEEIEAVNSWCFAADVINSAPSVPAVPLDKLCEWLAERYEPPYSLADIYKLKMPIDFNQQKEIWRIAITKWMEEQNANKE